MEECSSTGPCPKSPDPSGNEQPSSLTRRQFLNTGAAASGVLILGGAEACTPSGEGRDEGGASQGSGIDHTP